MVFWFFLVGRWCFDVHLEVIKYYNITYCMYIHLTIIYDLNPIVVITDWVSASWF